MCIDMIGAILRVILEHENCRVIPIGAMRYRIHHASDRQVVISNGGSRCRFANPGSASVIVRQPQLNEPRQFVCAATSFYKSVKFAKKLVGTELVRVFNREIRVQSVNVISLSPLGRPNAFQPRNWPRPGARPSIRIAGACGQPLSRFDFARRARCRNRRWRALPWRSLFFIFAPSGIQHLSINAKGQFVLCEIVPEKAGSWIIRHRNTLIESVSRVLRTLAPAIDDWPDLLDVVGCGRGIGPKMAICRHISAVIEVVQYTELQC